MTDRSVATVAASEAVAGIRGMSRLLELYKGSDLARLYEIQTKQKKRLIIGAQPLIPPGPEAMMNMQLQLFEGTEGAKKIYKRYFAHRLVVHKNGRSLRRGYARRIDGDGFKRFICLHLAV